MLPSTNLAKRSSKAIWRQHTKEANNILGQTNHDKGLGQHYKEIRQALPNGS